jgi:dihydrolipoyl dehydrogenase
VEAVWTGRKPNSVGIGLGGLGIDDGSFLKVDEQMRLPAPGLYAVGDVNGISLLDSTAFSQVSVAIDCVLGGKADSINGGPLVASTPSWRWLKWGAQ